MTNTIEFKGNIPQHYEDILTPFLFDPFSSDLMERILSINAKNVLELACGTGSVTRQIAAALSPDAHLLATDIQPGMLEVAKKLVKAANVSWDVVDMTNVGFVADSFDLIVCQFGLMLVPEKLKALQEMHRVLQKGGRLIFSVWGRLQDNPVWDISGKVIETFLGANPMLQHPGPFSMSAEDDTLKLLQQAGFDNIKATYLTKTGKAESAETAAKGFIQGLPVFMAINQKVPELVGEIEQSLAFRLKQELGDQHFSSPMTAWVFEIIK